MVIEMKTYEKNETITCKCGAAKSENEIYCFDCANYWASMTSGQNLPFKNTNGSVKWMNAMMDNEKAYERPDAYAPPPLPLIPVVVPPSSLVRRSVAGPYNLNAAPSLDSQPPARGTQHNDFFANMANALCPCL